MKSCTKCWKIKKLEEFYNSKRGARGKRSSCKDCDIKYKQAQRGSNIDYIITDIMSNIKVSEKRRSVEVTVSKEELKKLLLEQSYKCAISGERMTSIKGKKCQIPTNISIDRIDPSKGYILDNLQFVCWKVNQMKGEQSLEEMKKWCRKVLRK